GLAAAAVLVFGASGAAHGRRILLPLLALAGLGFLFATKRPPWDPMLMTSGMYHYASSFEDHSREGIRRYSIDLYDLLYYEEGLASVVTVAQNKGTPHR